MSITGLAVRKPITVLVLTAFIIVVGLISYFSLPREAAPDVKIPFMIVSTVYPGVAPEDIENLVTRKIEQELKTLKNVEEITSSSSESVSIIAIEFDPKVDLDYALQRVKDKVESARQDLPEDAEEPVVTEINFENMPIINIILTADYDLVKLKKVADDFADDFEAIPGVLEAKITGALEREVKIKIDPARLSKYNLSLHDVTRTIQTEHVTIPGGAMEVGGYTYSVRVPGEIKDPYAFANLVVTATAQGPVYIRDVAEVEYGFKDRETISRLNGKPCITLSVTKRAGENIILIADEVKRIIAEREPSLPRGTHVVIQGDYSKFIRVMLRDLQNHILSGFVLVVLCIFVFLGVTNSFFIATAIPLSMLIAFVVIQMMGVTLNFIVLFSLIIALGRLVDDAIVVVENIHRHRSMGKGPVQGAIDGTNEVAAAVVSSTLTTVAAYAPMLFWPGIMGEFMKYLPITVIVVLMASLFVALVINPVFCSRFMRMSQAEVDRFTGGSGFYHRVIIGNYEKVLRLATHRPKSTLAVAVLGLAASVALYGALGKGVEFMPQTDPDAAWISIKGPVGMRVEATDALAGQLEKTAAGFPDIANVVSNVGVSASAGDLSGGFNTQNEARIYMDFVDFDERSQASLKTFEESVDKVKYATGAEVRLDKEENGPPMGEPVEIQVTGDDYLTLGGIAKDLRARIKDIPGLGDLKDDFESSKPELTVRVDREKAAVLGLSTQDVAVAVRTAINGVDAGDFRIEEDDYKINVRFAEQYRQSLGDLDRIFVFKDGRQIPLSSVAETATSAGLGTIRRADLERVVTITGSNYGRLANDVLTDVKARLRGHELPSGYSIKYRGQDEEQQAAASFLMKALVITLLVIGMVLVTQFDSVVIVLIIMSSVIMSTIGALWGLMVAGLPFGVVMTGIGVISLAGVVVTNAIVLLDYVGKLRSWGRSKLDAVIEAGRTRFRPVILTALTTIVGIVPLAAGWAFDLDTLRFTAGGSSSQWWAPMAVVIISGLSFATLLTLIVVPSIYMLLGPSEESFHRQRD
ncbi:MAG: efflux RND transporter permease subunit [Candidatus Latescibacterota bacterium]|jgi:CzcA family heavy metal efflux pump